jgi:hypothetical protein
MTNTSATEPVRFHEARELAAHLANSNWGDKADPQWEAIVQRQAGSNYQDNVVLLHKETGRVLDAKTVGMYIFSSGGQAHKMWDHWKRVTASCQLPEGFTWETAIVVAAARNFHLTQDGGNWDLRSQMHMMSVWAWLQVDARAALGLKS